jgi:D-alanyl-lipoteichoic acid acyltransferase DltB (MBOAT superfamily)
LVAGPIVRASEFIPQLYTKFHLGRREFSHALFLISKGLIKKIIISDFIAVNFVDRVFDTPAFYSGFENLMAVYGYGLQIYCDFSGYTDIAIGVAMLMGFRLPLNFNSPYKASNISDFWKRWHITLSRWLKDYLYIPLGGNRHGAVRTGISLMLTMLIGGLWHGAATRFVIWGGLHGIALVIDRIWQWIFCGVKRKSRFAHLAGIIITFNFVSFAWIFFRAASLHDALYISRHLVSGWRAYLAQSWATIVEGFQQASGPGLYSIVNAIFKIMEPVTKESRAVLVTVTSVIPDAFIRSLIILRDFSETFALSLFLLKFTTKMGSLIAVTPQDTTRLGVIVSAWNTRGSYYVK